MHLLFKVMEKKSTKYLKLVFFFILMGGMVRSYAGEAHVYGSHQGYLDNISGERQRKTEEMVLIDSPKSNEVSLMDQIFNSELTKEIKELYERRFGHTDVERNWMAPSRFATLEYSNGIRVTPEEDVQRKRGFAEYMVKKLSEYHVDKYWKSHPSLKPIYKVKQKVSHINVKTKTGYKYKFGYFYAGNYLRFEVENPYKIRNQLIFQMNPNGLGPSNLETIIFHLGYSPTQNVNLDSYYASKENSVTIVTSHRFSPSLTMTLSGISGKSEVFSFSGKRLFKEGKSEMENKILFGISWRD